jgi:arylformamidase
MEEPMFVELSHLLRAGMPNFPDAPSERFEPLERQEEGDEGNTSSVRHFMHNGTHADAPFHFDSSGQKIDALPIESFIYSRPILVEIPKACGEIITKADLEKHDVGDADAILVHSGFDSVRSMDPASYRVLYPGFTREAASWLRARCPRLKAVVLDFLSADNYFIGNREGHPAHRELLCGASLCARPPLIIEDADMRPVIGKRLLRLFALPIRFEGAEAAPVCLVAEVAAD